LLSVFDFFASALVIWSSLNFDQPTYAAPNLFFRIMHISQLLCLLLGGVGLIVN